jgi:VNT family MFS transporter (synaptic vesicle glycoprotein 2)
MHDSPSSPSHFLDTHSQGDEAETLNILRRIHRINNPNDMNGYGVTKVIEDVEFIDESRDLGNVSENPFLLLWKQTCLLFSNKNAKNMVIVCLMQCGLFSSCHGLYMFFPEIVDKLATYSNQFPDGRASICEVLQVEDEIMTNATKYSIAVMRNASTQCSEHFELSTFFHSLIMELLYMVGFLLITCIINRTSKLSILLVILFGCSVSGFATLFVNIPLLSVYIYVMFMLLFLSVNVVNAATVDLFPTNLR